MASGNDQLWRGTSPEERADERRGRLIDACVEIIGQGGAGAVGVRAVCRSANVSHRYFYEWFADTDALLLASYEHAVQQLLREVGGAMAERNPGAPDARDQLRVGFDAATEFLQRRPAQGRLIFAEALANDVLRRRATPTLLHVVRGIAAGSGDPAPPRSHLETTLLSGGLAAVFIEWLSGTAKFSRDELVDYCTEATLMLAANTPRS